MYNCCLNARNKVPDSCLFGVHSVKFVVASKFVFWDFVILGWVSE
jgi:hypothetical protein